MTTNNERNEFLEADGLYWESETNEWFHDKLSTKYAKRADLENIFCFITRNKETGEYDRVVVDSNTNRIIYDSKSMEAIGAFIDMMKIAGKFKNQR